MSHTIDPDTLAKAHGVLGMIASDMEEGVVRDEGLPFTGENVARSLGEIRAAVQAIANIVHACLPAVETVDHAAIVASWVNEQGWTTITGQPQHQARQVLRDGINAPAEVQAAARKVLGFK